jgi:hypothetical protein
MDDVFHHQIGTYQHRLEHLLRDGRDLHRSLLTIDRDLAQDLEAMRLWQRECAATISQLSGGSKQHWLSRAYSDAFLPRLPASSGLAPTAVEEVQLDTIVERILGVLGEAQVSLVGMQQSGPPADAIAPAPRRFTFVHDRDLRPRLEQAYVDAQASFDRGAHALATVTWASMLEAMLTDALEHHRSGQDGPDTSLQPVADLTFDARIRAAEQARLISAGCARLPSVARRYRELLDGAGEVRADASASERDARITGQVLRLIMRDLAPGR